MTEVTEETYETCECKFQCKPIKIEWTRQVTEETSHTHSNFEKPLVYIDKKYFFFRKQECCSRYLHSFREQTCIRKPKLKQYIPYRSGLEIKIIVKNYY